MGGSQQSGFSSWPTSPDRPDSSSLGPPPLRPWSPGDDPILHLSDDLVLFLEVRTSLNRLSGE
ncbi:hypothetical protein PGTUg99_036713 [Puccinia graminis f. sp. tritici]|uniref:Uncharacterized protein n=1 Tax=Puccinia graminis f. sp. tritici TaxID=56615 RepID=A0A5B0SHD0_PUCGR|nr:hypothetical protein PGTUg99_036713 [Puccinia graminis f. sp. tritici]